MAPHSSTLAWKIPWMEEPGRLQSMGSWRVGHDWATSLSLFTFMHWRKKWQPTPVFLPGESQGREPGRLPSMGSYRAGHDWSDAAATLGRGLLKWLGGKESACQCRRRKRLEMNPWVEKSRWRRKWLPISPVLLPGKSHGPRSLAGYSPWGCQESDMTEWQHTHTHTHTHARTCTHTYTQHLERGNNGRNCLSLLLFFCLDDSGSYRMYRIMA